MTGAEEFWAGAALSLMVFSWFADDTTARIMLSAAVFFFYISRRSVLRRLDRLENRQ